MHTIPLESPTLMQNSFWPMVKILTQVLPEKRMSRFDVYSSSLQLRNALLKAIHASSVLSGSSIPVFCS